MSFCSSSGWQAATLLPFCIALVIGNTRNSKYALSIRASHLFRIAELVHLRYTVGSSKWQDTEGWSILGRVQHRRRDWCRHVGLHNDSSCSLKLTTDARGQQPQQHSSCSITAAAAVWQLHQNNSLRKAAAQLYVTRQCNAMQVLHESF